MYDIAIITITIRPQNLATLAQELFSQLATFDGNVQLEHIIVLDHLTLTHHLKNDLEQQYQRAKIKLSILNFNTDQEPSLYEKLATMRNMGAATATSRYLAFWDDDNKWTPDHLSSLYDILENQPEYGAAHSWRRLTDENGLPMLVHEDQYPWITYNAKASKEMYRLQLAEGIFEKNSSVIKDKFGYGPYHSDCCVDTGEWLIKACIFENIGRFKEKQSAVEKMYCYTDDQILGLRFISHRIKVICSEKPTLIYSLGGYSQRLPNVSEDTKITVHDVYSLALSPHPSTYRYQFIQLLNVNITPDSLRAIKITDRVPLSSESLSVTQGTAPWSVPPSALNDDAMLKILHSSPYAIGFTPAMLIDLNNKFLSIPWERWGAIIEPIIRKKFQISSVTPISIMIFGGILWKQENTQDLDILVIIEHPSDMTINVGSPHAAIPWPEELLVQYSFQRIDISIIGRGALLDSSKHSGDLTNICVWAHQGVCVKGNPALTFVNHQNLLQDIFTTLGFGFKNVLPSTKQANSFKKHLILAVKITCYLSRLYNTSLEGAVDDNRSVFEERSLSTINSFDGSLEIIMQKSMPWLLWIDLMAIRNHEAIQSHVIEFNNMMQEFRCINPMFIEEMRRIHIPSLKSVEAKHVAGLLLKTAVILVSFNRPEMLIQILPRLLSQDYYHLVIVDNASHDPLTLSILKFIKNIDPRVHVFFNKKNLHLSIARNQCLDFLQNNTRNVKLIMVMDNDIILPQNSIEIASKIFISSLEMRQISMVPALPDFPIGEVFCLGNQRLTHTLHNCTGAQSVFRAALVFEHHLRYREQTYVTPHSVGEDFWFTQDAAELVKKNRLPWKNFAWFAADNPILAKDLGRDGAYMIQHLEYYIHTFADRKTLDYLKRLIQKANVSQLEIDEAISKIESYENEHGGAESLETPFTMKTLLTTFAIDKLITIQDPNTNIQASIDQLKEIIETLSCHREILYQMENKIFQQMTPVRLQALKHIIEASLSCFLNILSFTEKHPLFSQSIFQANMYLNRMRIYINELLLSYNKTMPLSNLIQNCLDLDYRMGNMNLLSDLRLAYSPNFRLGLLEAANAITYGPFYWMDGELSEKCDLQNHIKNNLYEKLIQTLERLLTSVQAFLILNNSWVDTNIHYFVDRSDIAMALIVACDYIRDQQILKQFLDQIQYMSALIRDDYYIHNIHYNFFDVEYKKGLRWGCCFSNFTMLIIAIGYANAELLTSKNVNPFINLLATAHIYIDGNVNKLRIVLTAIAILIPLPQKPRLLSYKLLEKLCVWVPDQDIINFAKAVKIYATNPIHYLLPKEHDGWPEEELTPDLVVLLREHYAPYQAVRMMTNEDSIKNMLKRFPNIQGTPPTITDEVKAAFVDIQTVEIVTFVKGLYILFQNPTLYTKTHINEMRMAPGQAVKIAQTLTKQLLNPTPPSLSDCGEARTMAHSSSLFFAQRGPHRHYNAHQNLDCTK